jgi:D-alanyl-D-alanine carboxypeptidase/D-alanyl-D-alanine-endopeptidase (penicillin-binding protein 4)
MTAPRCRLLLLGLSLFAALSPFVREGRCGGSSVLGTQHSVLSTLTPTLPDAGGGDKKEASETRNDSDLATRIEAVINQPRYKEGHWGLLVVEAAGGRTVYSHDPDRLCTPASTTKLYSCSTALAELGPDYRFVTPVHRRGEVKDGRLQGDLILVASGDLTLGGRTDADGHCLFTSNDHTYATTVSTTTTLTPTDPLAGLDALAAQVAAGGVKSVTGDVLIDDRLFNHERGSGSGPDRLTPMIVNDNVIDLTVTPAGKAGEPASVAMRPATAWVQMDAQVTTAEAGRSPFIDVIPVGPQRFMVRGRVAQGSKPLVRIWPVDDPAGFARALFIECLRRHGVAVAASPLRPPTAPLPERGDVAKLPVAARFTSPPLSEAIKVTLKVSHNLYASTLPLLVAAKHGGRTLADGLHRQQRFLRDLGVDVSAVSFAGGAGGSNADATTPRATVTLLRAMAKRPEYPALLAGLPVLGADGTLADAVPPDSPARGKVFAKTGTLSWQDVLNDRVLLRSKALAGTMTTARGTELVFALFVNDTPLPPGETAPTEGKTLGRLSEIIYQYGP